MDWYEYALSLADAAAKKSKDPWRKVGCCLLRHDNTPILGYNGFPKGIQEDWSDRNERRDLVVHAEQNALRYARPEECYLAAVNLLPCKDCIKALASYGIRKVVYREMYEFDETALTTAEKLGIELVKIE